MLKMKPNTFYKTHQGGTNMSSIKTQEVLFTLKSITTQSDFTQNHNTFEVIFMLKDAKNTANVQYVVFLFSSFDKMYQSLKSLANYTLLLSVDNLMQGEYPAIIEVEEHFNVPPTFKAFKLLSNYIWPYKDCPAHFLLDYPE